MSNDNEATGAGPGITADQARAISTLARTHKDQGAELTERQFREMTSLQRQIGLSGHTVAGVPLSALALNEPNSAPNRLTDPAQSFQDDVATWMGQCFPSSLSSNMTERGDRLLEEVLELLQAHGYDSARVPTLVNYVFGRPVGEPAQEVGGVMVTLAAYCSVAGLSVQANGQAELDRIIQPEVMARIRAKQESKNALHFDTPLPGAAAQSSPAGQRDVPYDIARDLLADAYNAGRNGIGFSEQVMRLDDALAARQPVGATGKDSLTVGGGQAVVSAHRFIQNHQGLEHTIWMDGDASDSEVEAERTGVGRIERAYAGPPAQADFEPAAWVHEDDPARVISARQKATALRDQGASGSSVRPYSVPAYLHAARAPAVDLEQFRECVELMEWQERGHANPDWPVGDPKKHAEALRLLAMIDSQAVRHV